jgi:hypothetical protein
VAGNATHLAPLLQRMPWDALTIGNHELYHKAVVETMAQPGGMLATFGDRYLTSNVMYADTSEPLGRRYRLLTGHRHSTLVFGFLYNLHNPSESIHIKMVENAVQEEWFETALREEKYDAIMVLSHMDVNDPLIKVINNAIRKIVPDRTPIQFITGHSHIRAQSKVDVWSHSYEAGAFLDTVGFVSFPARATALASSGNAKDAGRLFQYRFLDANTETLRTILDVEELATNNGKELSRLIDQAQVDLGLRQIVGCPPRNYYVNRSLHQADSLWKLYQDEVVPSQLFQEDNYKAMFITSDSWRYDVRSGPVDGRASNQMTIDDVVAVAPYNEPIYYIGDVNGWTLKKMNSSLNTYSVKKTLPDWVLAGDVKDIDHAYKVYSHEANVPWIKKELERLNVKTFKMLKTGDTDTLMWLEYIQSAWPCPRLNGDKEVYKKAVPWWVDPVTLAIEAGDGEEDEENEEGLELEDPTPIDDNDSPSSASTSSSGKSPTTTVMKPTSGGGVNNQHIQNHEKHKKTKRRIKKTVAISIALVILIFPFWGMYHAIFGVHNPVADMGATFYDPSEMKALKRGDTSGGRRRGKRGRRGYKDIPESEIEFV